MMVLLVCPLCKSKQELYSLVGSVELILQWVMLDEKPPTKICVYGVIGNTSDFQSDIDGSSPFRHSKGAEALKYIEELLLDAYNRWNVW